MYLRTLATLPGFEAYYGVFRSRFLKPILSARMLWCTLLSTNET